MVAGGVSRIVPANELGVIVDASGGSEGHREWGGNRRKDPVGIQKKLSPGSAHNLAKIVDTRRNKRASVRSRKSGEGPANVKVPKLKVPKLRGVNIIVADNLPGIIDIGCRGARIPHCDQGVSYCRKRPRNIYESISCAVRTEGTNNFARIADATRLRVERFRQWIDNLGECSTDVQNPVPLFPDPTIWPALLIPSA